MARIPTLQPEHEKQLVDRAQAGDGVALGELLEAYHKRVYHVCLRMVGKHDDASDLAQETLLRVVKHIGSFRQGSQFGTWLVRIAMNLSISHLRKAKLRSTMSLDREAHGGSQGEQSVALRQLMASDREPSPPQSVETDEQVRILNAALEALDPLQKGVILLRDIQGMDYQQIAESLEVPVGTIKSRLFRARLALREAMDKTPISPGGVSPASKSSKIR